MPFGSVLIFDLKDCLTHYLNDKLILQHLIDNIISIMNMKAVGNTVFEYFEANEFNISNDLVGYSITQIISMSSITIHICEISKNVYIDIFTCCKLNEDIINKLQTYIELIFNPTSLKHQIINRP